MAKRNMLRLGEIIEDLLDLSRVQTGKMDIEFKELDDKTIEKISNFLKKLFTIALISVIMIVCII